ncbi:MAG: DNA cytosine methyltransferase [Bdellovibrionaceae bacterium]|nr:DNA cytosine methyltransferase [Pseudobdellovibrionaceae bacterium]
MSRKNIKKVISLYTGAGGLDYGIEAAGFDDGVLKVLDWSTDTILDRTKSMAQKAFEEIWKL